MNLSTALKIFHSHEDILVIGSDIDDWVGDDNIDYNLTIEDDQVELHSYQVINGNMQTLAREKQITYYSGNHKNFKSWAIKNGLQQEAYS